MKRSDDKANLLGELASIAAAGPLAERVSFVPGATLISRHAFPSAFLIVEGLVAMMARTRDGVGEAGLLGPGEIAGLPAALGGGGESSEAVALTEVRAVALDVETLAARSAFRARLMIYAAERVAGLERLCACAVSHSIEQRLAGWLVTASDLAGDTPIRITHEQLARLFGVRRASVTESLHLLEGRKAVRCSRGRIEIRDRALLEAASCGCRQAG